MIYIAGLGNPGKKYEHTRHNVGFVVVEKVAASFGAANFQPTSKWSAEIAKIDSRIFIKPQTFMNDSGRAVRAVIDFYDKNLLAQPNAELKNLFVIHDDLDLEVGTSKIQFAKGPKVHNGLTSISQSLGTDQFWHIRIGVDSRHGDRSTSPQDYVLSGFSPAEREALNHVFLQVITELRQKIQ